MGRALPHNLETERALLGGLLLDRSQIPDTRGILEVEDFHRAWHQTLYRAMAAMEDAGIGVDITTVLDWIETRALTEACGGASYVLGLPSACVSVESVESCTARVKDHAIRRRVHLAAQRILEQVADGGIDTATLLNEAQKAVMGIDLIATAGEGYREISAVVDEAVEDIRKRAENPGTSGGLPTGFTDLDRLTTGLHPTDLVILAARPAMGKSMLGFNIATHVAQRGIPVGVVSLEMADVQLAQRGLAAEARFDHQAMRAGKIDGPNGWRQLLDAQERLRALPIHIDHTGGQSIALIRSRARALKRRNPKLGLLVIDYLQLAEGTGGPKQYREQAVAEVSRGLKGLAKELELPIIALAQLNRGLEARTNKRPMPSDLRESGSLEQDADAIWFLYRDEIYNDDTPDRGIAEVIVAKQRHGPLGMVKLAFIGKYQLFQNLAGGGYDEALPFEENRGTTRNLRGRRDSSELDDDELRR